MASETTATQQNAATTGPATETALFGAGCFWG